jgi:hypothetical protein
MQRWRERSGQIGEDVVPSAWNAIMRQVELNAIHAENFTNRAKALVLKLI